MLLGYYPFDDEGVPAEDVHLVDHGVLKTFLMSRSPLINIPHSNGHGRRQLGYVPVARQGNLIVTSSNTMTNAQLRQKLIELVKQQGKPFGLLIDDIAGGFTFTGRGHPQAFQVPPLVVYKVFPDGRPDELVRGVDIVGTPLVSLTKIVATGDTPEIFNGYCGAESGSVPVSAVAPAILISEMEVQQEGILHGQAADSAASRARSRSEGSAPVKKILSATVARGIHVGGSGLRCGRARRYPTARSAANRWRKRRTRLGTRSNASRHARRNGALAHAAPVPGVDKPFYVEYRLLDLDVRTITASFGALISSNTDAQPLHEHRRARRATTISTVRISSAKTAFRVSWVPRASGNRPRLQFPAPGPLARHRSGL